MKRLTKTEKEDTFNRNRKKLLKLRKDHRISIGIDLGTFNTGYSVREDNFSINDKSKQIIERIHKITIEAKQYIRLNNSNAIALIEDYAFAGKTVIQEAELGGNIKRLLWRHKIPYMVIAPTTLKKFVLGQGKGVGSSKKELMLLECYKKWGKSFEDNNICDAFCLKMFLDTLFIYLKGENKFAKWEQDMFRDFVINRGNPVM